MPWEHGDPKGFSASHFNLGKGKSGVQVIIKGRVQRGKEEAAGFLALPWVEAGLKESLGYIPYPGTLNLKLAEQESLHAFKNLVAGPAPFRLTSPDPNFCDASLFPALLKGGARCAIVWPQVVGQPEDVVELVGPEGFRNRFKLEDGDECHVAYAGGEISIKSAPEAVIFDFEGTLVDFQWKLAEAEGRLRDLLADLGFDLALFEGDNYAQMRTRALSLAGSDEFSREIDRRFALIYETYDADALTRWNLQPGARELLAGLANRGIKLAIVSNVGRKSLVRAVDRLGLTGIVSTVVTRNDVSRAKPSGEGIWKALDELGVPAEDSLMVGDSLSDLMAARDAGVRVALLLGGESPAEKLIAAAPDHLLTTLAALAAIL